VSFICLKKCLKISSRTSIGTMQVTCWCQCVHPLCTTKQPGRTINSSRKCPVHLPEALFLYPIRWHRVRRNDKGEKNWNESAANISASSHHLLH